MKCPESIEEYEEMMRELPLCKTTLYEQARARIESGAAKSQREAARQLADETERPENSIRSAIRREECSLVDALHPKTNEQFRTSFTGDNEWYTPVEYIEAAREVIGAIDLDPATSEFGQSRIRATIFHTVETDGLKAPWIGNIWLNPPYAQPDIFNFIEKAVKEWNAGNIKQAVILTHNYTDTAWFHLAESAASLICFTKGRVKFEKSDGTIAAPTQGSAFFYFGTEKNKFREVFSTFGFIR